MRAFAPAERGRCTFNASDADFLLPYYHGYVTYGARHIHVCCMKHIRLVLLTSEAAFIYSGSLPIQLELC